MTQNQTSNSNAKQTPQQQQHQQAGEHLEQASKSHKEAAKLYGAGDQKAADQQAQIAQDHTVQAGQIVANASKQNSSNTSQQR